MRNPLRTWLDRQHGTGEAHQEQFYRCLTCRGIVTWKHIRSGGCQCGAARIAPTNPTLGEKLRLLIIPWGFYAGGDDYEG